MGLVVGRLLLLEDQVRPASAISGRTVTHSAGNQTLERPAPATAADRHPQADQQLARSLVFSFGYLASKLRVQEVAEPDVAERLAVSRKALQ
jgi:hypothetical protein